MAATTSDRVGLWKSDGTQGGTVVLRDWPSEWPLDENEGRFWPTPVGTRLFFGVLDAEGAREMWRTDGTLPGTARLRHRALEER